MSDKIPSREQIAEIARRWIYCTAHDGPRHLCNGIATDVLALHKPSSDAERLEEAVRLLEPFARLSAKLSEEGVLVEVCRPHPDNPSRRIEPFLTQHLRAAAAFLLTLTQDAGAKSGDQP